MPKEAMIRARTGFDLKNQVDGILEKLGLNSSSAINLFYKQIALHNGLPFDVRVPNAKTLKAMKDAKSGKTKKGFKNSVALFKGLDE